jgi:O-antigen ligase
VATIVLFACALSSVEEVHELGRQGRWVALAALACVAALCAWGAWPWSLVPAASLLAAFVALALVSTAWSVAPSLTAQRAASLALLAVAAISLAIAGRAAGARPVVVGIVAGAAAVAVAGVATLAVDPDLALLGEFGRGIPRFQGFGTNPNSAAMLFALALPFAAVLVLEARARGPRLAAGAAFALVALSLAASGSRGAIVGGVLGLVVLAVAAGGAVRRRLVLASVALAALSILAVTQQTIPPPTAAATPQVPASPGSNAPRNPGALGQELGERTGDNRTFASDSGRRQAWEGALEQGNERPLLGHGFGTEQIVFVDRYYAFDGDVPSQSWLGVYLQLGLVGVLLAVALFAALAAAAVRAVRSAAGVTVAAACAGCFVAALPLTFVESWFYSVGNLGTVTFWIGAMVLGSLVAAPRPDAASEGDVVPAGPLRLARRHVARPRSERRIRAVP